MFVCVYMRFAVALLGVVQVGKTKSTLKVGLLELRWAKTRALKKDTRVSKRAF